MNADRPDLSRPLLFRFAKPADREPAPYRYDHERSLNVTDEHGEPVAFAASAESSAYLKTVKTEGGEE